MKTLQNQTIMSVAILAIASSTIFYSCKKEQAVNSNPIAEKETSATLSAVEEKLASLAERMEVEADENSIKAAVAEFRALNAEQLDIYNKVRGQRDLAKLNAEYRKAAGRMSKADFDFQSHRINQIAKLRLEVNRLAVERHGQSANQLDAVSPAKVDAILDELMSTKFAGLKNDKTPDEVASVSACENLSFPLSTTIGGEDGVDDNAIYRVKSDCDYRFMYPGARSKLDSDNGVTWTLMEQMDWSTGRYVYSTNTLTRIILGYNRVTFICGGPNNVNLEMLP